MSEVHYVKLTNDCDETLIVYLRHGRPKKVPDSQISPLYEIKIPPKHESPPLAVHMLVGAKIVGAKDWEERGCLKRTEIPFEPRFVELINISTESLSLQITPAAEPRKREITKVIIEPEETSRIIDLKSVKEPKVLSKLEKEKKIEVRPVLIIGPSTNLKGAVGSYVGESFYICYECGGPIIFRGSPPKPIHI